MLPTPIYIHWSRIYRPARASLYIYTDVEKDERAIDSFSLFSVSSILIAILWLPHDVARFEKEIYSSFVCALFKCILAAVESLKTQVRHKFARPSVFSENWLIAFHQSCALVERTMEKRVLLLTRRSSHLLYTITVDLVSSTDVPFKFSRRHMAVLLSYKHEP